MPDIFADNPYFLLSPKDDRARRPGTLSNMLIGPSAGIASRAGSGQPWFAGVAPGAAIASNVNARQQQVDDAEAMRRFQLGLQAIELQDKRDERTGQLRTNESYTAALRAPNAAGAHGIPGMNYQSAAVQTGPGDLGRERTAIAGVETGGAPNAAVAPDSIPTAPPPSTIMAPAALPPFEGPGMRSIQPGALTSGGTPQFKPMTMLPRNASSSAPKTIDGLVASVPTSTAELAKRLLAGMAGVYRKHQQFGNAAVREPTLGAFASTDPAANADLLDRIASRLAIANRPRTIQRVAASGGTQQSMQQE